MTDGNLVGFSPTSANTPTGSPPVARNSSIGHSNITNAQLDFKTWFFQTAAQNPPEASETKSPRQLRRTLRRAWKALEQSPYYKTLRSEHISGNFQNINFKELEDAFISASKSAPGSPKHRSPKRKRAKSAGKIIVKQSSSESTKMRPSSAAPAKVRPFSAGSVGSSSSSEGSESGAAASGGDDAKKKLIPLTKRIFPPSKVRPKSSGILKKSDYSSTQSLPQQSAVGGGSTSTVLTTVDETQSTLHSPRFKSATNMVIDSGNVTSDTAQLVSQPDHSDTGSTRSSIKSASSKKLSKFAAVAAAKKDDGKKHFADLKIIDETSKRSSAKSSSKSASTTPRGSSAGSQQKGPKRTGMTALKATLASVQSTTSMASSLSSHSSAQPLQGEGIAHSSTIPEQDVGDGSSSKGSKDAKSSEKSFSSASASTAGPRSSIRKSSDQKSDQKGGSEKASDAGSSSKDSGSKESAKKEGSGTKDSKKHSTDSTTGGKKPSNDDLSKAAAAAAATAAAATITSANATVAGDSNADAGAPAEKTEADPKAPLKREMSRISVKTNESRKSIDMSKHIMNLIQGGQNQEEQTKKPQTTNQSYIQQAIPALPMAAAVLCLLLNLVAPGIGTILSGFFVICIGKPRIEAKENALGLT